MSNFFGNWFGKSKKKVSQPQPGQKPRETPKPDPGADHQPGTVRQVEVDIRVRPVDLRPSVRAFAPGPRRRVDAKRTAHQRARHEPAEREHQPVLVVPEAVEARAFPGRHPGQRLRDAPGSSAECARIRDEHAHLAGRRP